MNEFLFIHSDVDDAGLTPLQFRLYAHLSRRAGADGQIYSSIADMAAVCGLAPNTIKIALRELKQLNIVATEQREGHTALRRIRPPSEWKINPVRKTTGVEIRPGAENDSPPSTKKVPPPGTKNAPQRVSKEGNPRKGNPIQVALPFESEVFSAAWADWLRHLIQKRKTPTEMAINAQLGRCAGWGEERALAAIRHSIAGNYQGLFEPSSHVNGSVFAPPFGRSKSAEVESGAIVVPGLTDESRAELLSRRARSTPQQQQKLQECEAEGIAAPVLKIV